MPPKNSVKVYLPDSYYHIYNRGVEKRTIFKDQQDYNVFLHYLSQYLLPKDMSLSSKEERLKMVRLRNFSEEIDLVAYCLMPNHFHFLFYQKNETGIARFMNSFANRYAMYFNKKYKRVGSLYQDVYKAVLIETENQLLHLSRYIHRNPFFLQGDPLQFQPSSYSNYLGKKHTSWIHPQHILQYFSKTNKLLTYQSFVESEGYDEAIANLMIDSD